MLTLLRHLLSILLLPFLVVVVTPYWLRTAFAAGDSHWGSSSLIAGLSRFISVGFVIAGFVLFVDASAYS